MRKTSYFKQRKIALEYSHKMKSETRIHEILQKLTNIKEEE